MKAEQFSKNILDLDPAIRFAGMLERSGRLYAGSMRPGIEQHLKGRNPELSFSQSAYIIDLRNMFTSELGKLNSVIYIYERVKMISVPVKEHILVLSTDIAGNTEEIMSNIHRYIKSVESELSLYPPTNIINSEKKQILINLHESGIPEDMIADQLDLDILTVKSLIDEIDRQ
jgi:hypothetical protein